MRPLYSHATNYFEALKMKVEVYFVPGSWEQNKRKGASFLTIFRSGMNFIDYLSNVCVGALNAVNSSLSFCKFLYC